MKANKIHSGHFLFLFLDTIRGNALCTECGTRKGRSVPTNPPSSQATRSHPGKAKSYEPKALNETMLPMRRKKSLTISHTQHRAPPIPTTISTKKKECGREKEKVNKGKTGGKLKERKLVKFN